MEERFLFSDVWPLLARGNREVISDCFREELKKSDRLEISVGFFSCHSLKELDRLVFRHNIKNVCLILGMYYFCGFPKNLHRMALNINKKWQQAGIGEIRITYSLRYHGKLYCFIKDNQIFSVIIGSPNLSFLSAAPITRPSQYEIALFSDNPKTLQNSLEHISELKSKNVSANIAIFENKQLLSEENIYLRKNKTALKIECEEYP